MADSLITRVGPDRFRVELGPDERRVLAALMGDLRQLLVEGSDPSLQRLYPPAYGEDAERNEEYQALAYDELLQKRLAGIERVEASAAADTLDEAQLSDWMRAVNELRLVLGTQLGVNEDEGPHLLPDDPERPRKELYHYLGWLLDDIVIALEGG